MNRNRLIAISLVAALVLVLMVVLVWMLLNQPKSESPATNTNTNTVVTNVTTTPTVQTNSNSNTPEVPTTTPVTTDDRQLITSTAISFTERFGSYSSDTHYENVDRSKYLMTDAMLQQANQLIASNSQSSETFVSVVNDVTTSTITDFSEGATGATVTVSVRQTKTEGSNAPVATNVKARLTLKKISGAWKVDSFRYE